MQYSLMISCSHGPTTGGDPWYEGVSPFFFLLSSYILFTIAQEGRLLLIDRYIIRCTPHAHALHSVASAYTSVIKKHWKDWYQLYLKQDRLHKSLRRTSKLVHPRGTPNHFQYISYKECQPAFPFEGKATGAKTIGTVPEPVKDQAHSFISMSACTCATPTAA